ncbi:MAG TPA: hypothetical protein VNO82_12020 [Solirubrobacteraceae bacterium]|nr:hypothetical protein [Solirubrobacteraceae bacterium]
MMRRLAILAVLVLAGCGGDDAPPVPERDEPAQVGVPDGGMSAGHGDEPRRVVVPPRDRTAPASILRLASVEAVDGGRPPEPVALDSPVLEPTAVGRDKQGMTRIRVSLEARLRCGDEVVPVTRYFPPPEIARPRIPPGTRAPTELSRDVRFALECERGELRGADGALWADATSAWETESSSAPIRFTYRP